MNTILIVDDEKNIREGLKKALQPSNYHIFLAANGREALDIIVKEKINLAILDIQLPQMSGTELFHKNKCVRRRFTSDLHHWSW